MDTLKYYVAGPDFDENFHRDIQESGQETACNIQNLMGGKAAALYLAGPDLNIPLWFVVTPQAFLEAKKNLGLPKNIRNLVTEAVNKTIALNNEKNILFATRSSAVGEDGANASYAGQLQSFLNISPENVPEYIEKVWASALEQNVLDYRAHIDNGTMQYTNAKKQMIPAVLVQVMIDPLCAGVGFSVDPVSNDSAKMVISACYGLGDKLVSGQVNGDTWLISRSGDILEESCENVDTPILTHPQIKKLANLLVKMEKHFNTPQDIEWAIDKQGKLHLLQARPITTLQKIYIDAVSQITPSTDVSFISGKSQILWDNSNIVESYSGVTSPLTFSFARYIYDNVYREFCAIAGVSPKVISKNRDVFRNMLGRLNGHVYYNLLNWYRMIAMFPGFALNGPFMEQMMGVKEGLPEEYRKDIIPDNSSFTQKLADIFNLACSGFGLILNHFLLPRKVRAFQRRLDDALATPQKNLDSMPLDKLASEYRLMESKLLSHWDAPLINDFLCMIAFGASKKLLHKYGGQKGLDYHRDMLTGQGDIISAEPAKRIRKMAEKAVTITDLPEILSAGDTEKSRKAIAMNPEFASMLGNYLDKFGDRCLQELKLESLTMHEDPSTLLTSIGHLALRLKNTEMQKDTTPEKNERLAKENLNDIIGEGFFRNLLVKKTMHHAGNLVRGRENLRFERTRVFGRVRRLFMSIGKHFTDLGLLENPRDIFYLEVEEVLGAIEGTGTTLSLKESAKIRKNEAEKFENSAQLPDRLITNGAVFIDINKKLSENNAEAPKESFGVTDAKNHDKNSETLTGIGCCKGKVTATVRVIKDPRGAKLEAGEIMVAKFTDPGWITLFANASGILVERGSLLSHSAIVAREMGIPAIVALCGVTNWLNTGDIVEMDGARGTVVRVQKAKLHE